MLKQQTTALISHVKKIMLRILYFNKARKKKLPDVHAEFRKIDIMLENEKFPKKYLF